MKQEKKNHQGVVKAIFVIVAIVFSSMSAFAVEPQVPLESTLAKELSAEWWQLISSLPPGVNPAFDETGTACVVGQRGDVWFLAGSFSGQPTVRTCSVPEGKMLFFPVINQYQFNSPKTCGQGNENYTVKQLRANIAPLIDPATNLSVTLDGKEITTIQRVNSDPFEIALPEQNLFTFFGYTCAAGVYSPAVDDGFYAHVDPLNPGQHVLHIHAESGFVVDITYNLTVVPVKFK